MANILILSSVRFKEDLWQRPQQLAVQLASLGNKVVYFNPVPTIKISREEIEVDAILNEFVNNPVEDQGVIIYDQIGKIATKSSAITGVKTKWLDTIVDYHQFDKIIVYLPEYAVYLRGVKDKIDVYFDCVDEMSSFYTTKKIVLLENELVKMAKGVIVTSKTLYVHKSKENSNCVLIPNAVNPEQFQKQYKQPKDMENIKKPIVGYMGAIANWFDQDLMVEVANQNKDKEFLLIGTIYTDVSKLEAVENIKLFGKREYEEVPAYVNHFDVGIIPFKMEDLIVNTNPIKYFEYLAAGLKTVSTPLPELIGEPHCFLANDATSFTNMLNNVLNDKSKVEERHYLEENSWLERAKKINEFINETDVSDKRDRDTIIEEFLDVYNSFVGKAPLLDVLKAEILNDLGNVERAKEQLFNSSIGSECWETQIKLLLEWNCIDKLYDYMLKNEEITYDTEKWFNKGEEFLKVYALRKIKKINEAATLAVKLANQSECIQEEIGNIYFDIENYKDAIKRYVSIYKANDELLTKEGYKNFLKIAEAGGKTLLAEELKKKIAAI